MRTLALEQSNVTLKQAARLARKGVLVLTEKGKPVTAIVRVRDDFALEALALSRNKSLMAYLDSCAGRVARGGGASVAEVRKEFGLGKPPRRKASALGGTFTKRRQ